MMLQVWAGTKKGFSGARHEGGAPLQASTQVLLVHFWLEGQSASVLQAQLRQTATHWPWWTKNSPVPEQTPKSAWHSSLKVQSLSLAHAAPVEPVEPVDPVVPMVPLPLPLEAAPVVPPPVVPMVVEALPELVELVVVPPVVPHPEVVDAAEAVLVERVVELNVVAPVLPAVVEVVPVPVVPVVVWMGQSQRPPLQA